MKKIRLILISLITIYLILLIPEPADDIKVAQRTQFVWDRDSVWHSLEKHFIQAKKLGCTNSISRQIGNRLTEFAGTLELIEKQDLASDDKIIDNLMDIIFQTAPLIGACPDSSLRYIELIAQMRQIVKEKSRQWNPGETVTRNTLYKLIYGGRAAIEEIILQSYKGVLPSLSYENDEPSATPFATFLGVKINSGDILLSRGGAPT
ncbi:MAG: hypothetical protein Q8M94_07055, partial [Ignavibacteria bacterium]|nr:hypothetical protein [Ignavibacteria bacterium]